MKFGVREICDVTFKATSEGQKIGTRQFHKGQTAFFIDSAKTSSLEQATTTVYAQGGRGNARLVAWEGEKTMTFTVEDALISPQGLAVLSGAGLIPAETEAQHVHITVDAIVGADKTAKVTLDDIVDELGIVETDDLVVKICNTIPMFAMKMDGSGAGVDYFKATLPSESGDFVEVSKAANAVFTIAKDEFGTVEPAKDDSVKLDFYVYMESGVTNVTIAPEDFGGYYYIEADTLFRAEATGKDMAATITIPKAKVQSAMTFTMASSGDPSTFTFTMDAFPAYTYFDRTKKVMCTIQIVGTDGKEEDKPIHKDHEEDTP